MEVTLDQFGRILIPKKLRQLLGLHPGQRLELVTDHSTKTLRLALKPKTIPTLSYTDSGIPVFAYDSEHTVDFDMVEEMRRDREERDAKNAGL